MRSILAGLLAGLLVMVALVFFLPARWGHLKAVVAALAGFGVTLLVMNLVE